MKRRRSGMAPLAFLMALSCGFSLLQAQSPCTTLETQPISWWQGEGHARDLMRANHGGLVNGADFSDGQVGRAMRFDGANDFINLADNGSMSAMTAGTVEGWFLVDPNVSADTFYALFGYFSLLL